MHYSFLVILPEGFEGDSDKIISYVEKTLLPYVMLILKRWQRWWQRNCSHLANQRSITLTP